MSVEFRINGDKVIKHEKIKAKLGFTDKKNHNTFYIEGSGFITPNEDIDDFDEIMGSIKNSCKQSLKKRLISNKTIDRNFLMNFEVCSDRMKKNKKTFLSFQYHFIQKDRKNKSILDVKKCENNFFIDILNDVENELKNHNISIDKKKNV